MDPEVRDEVINRHRKKEAKAKAIEEKGKKKLQELAAEVIKIREEMEEPSYHLGVKHLEKLVQWKTQKGNKKLTSKKRADLLQRLNIIKEQESPHISQ